MAITLKEAVEVVNSACGRSEHTPLIVIATCQYQGKDGSVCGTEFPMLPQDYHRALEHNHPHICPECRPRYHRQKKKANARAKENGGIVS